MKMILQASMALTVLSAPPVGTVGASEALAWPEVTRECRPWSYWWWMGSAVDAENLTRELQRYSAAGWGGVHVIPIYGAKGYEERYLEYLSPQWMAMLRHAITEADRLGMGVDMTTGSGWCFGGPTVSDLQANARVMVKTFELTGGNKLTERLDRRGTQVLAAFSTDGKHFDLTDRISGGGTVNWTAPEGRWRVYAVGQKPSGRKVKRAAPGGEGHMLNPFYGSAIRDYLTRFDKAFATYKGPRPRAMYHDSYEYQCDWSPDLLAEFEKRRGYRLQAELPTFFGSEEEGERVARIKSDYRETVSDMMAENFLPPWVRWAKTLGCRTRNQAHGSPGNLLDLYAAVDIPETEMFHDDRSILVSKFASSAAHVAGRQQVAAETGTWLRDHFTVRLSDMKELLDDLFLAGVNHVIYHGTCYSPDDAGWPGWLFYASTEMNPRNAIWRDVPALNAYIARCQAVLQAGHPDNDVLLYWPIYDVWHDPRGRIQQYTVHRREWLERQPIGSVAERLWNRGFAFDCVSDRQLGSARSEGGKVVVTGGSYRTVAVPPCAHIPVQTMERLLTLARNGATVIFADQLPGDVPGWGDLERRRARFRQLVKDVKLTKTVDGKCQHLPLGKGRLLVGDLEAALTTANVARETMVDQEGLWLLRRRVDDGRYYFVANRGKRPINGWIPLATAASALGVMDPMTGKTGVGRLRDGADGHAQAYVQLPPGASIILRTLGRSNASLSGPTWVYHSALGEAVPISGTWRVEFISGGPELPGPLETKELVSWTQLGGAPAERFAGTARYSLTFDAPGSSADGWWLDLGKVCQSARVRLNGSDLGTLVLAPYRTYVDHLQKTGNLLQIEVTNLSANRIRDLDRRGVVWKNFHNINFVNIDYKPFDASKWPLADSGLIGPVRLIPVKAK